MIMQAEQLLNFWVNIRHPGALVRLEVSWVVQFVTGALPGACFWRKKMGNQSKCVFHVWAGAFSSTLPAGWHQALSLQAVPLELCVALVNQTSFLSLSPFPHQGFSVFSSPLCFTLFFWWDMGEGCAVNNSYIPFCKTAKIPVRQSYGA